MLLECVIDERYSGLGIFLIQVDTVKDNPHFTNGDVVMAVGLKSVSDCTCGRKWGLLGV